MGAAFLLKEYYTMSIKEQLMAEMKAAMKAHEAQKLSAVRLILAAVKQREVDERIEPTDDVVLAVLAKLIKQRRDSVEQYKAAKRDDLAAKEQFEIDLMQSYMPAQMGEDEIKAVISEVIQAGGFSGMASMGKVMGAVKAKVAGKADMGKVSALVKAALS